MMVNWESTGARAHVEQLLLHDLRIIRVRHVVDLPESGHAVEREQEVDI